jgi:hypothetical protein
MGEAFTFDEEPSKGMMTSSLSIMNVVVDWEVCGEVKQVKNLRKLSRLRRL